jgi:hypothetical protein
MSLHLCLPHSEVINGLTEEGTAQVNLAAGPTAGVRDLVVAGPKTPYPAA